MHLDDRFEASVGFSATFSNVEKTTRCTQLYLRGHTDLATWAWPVGCSCAMWQSAVFMHCLQFPNIPMLIISQFEVMIQMNTCDVGFQLPQLLAWAYMSLYTWGWLHGHRGRISRGKGWLLQSWLWTESSGQLQLTAKCLLKESFLGEIEISGCIVVQCTINVYII